MTEQLRTIHTLTTEVGTEFIVDIDSLRAVFREGKSDAIDTPWVVLRLVTWGDDVGAWVLTAKGSGLLVSDDEFTGILG